MMVLIADFSYIDATVPIIFNSIIDFSSFQCLITLASPDLLGAFYDHVDDKMAQL